MSGDVCDAFPPTAPLIEEARTAYLTAPDDAASGHAGGGASGYAGSDGGGAGGHYGEFIAAHHGGADARSDVLSERGGNQVLPARAVAPHL